MLGGQSRGGVSDVKVPKTVKGGVLAGGPGYGGGGVKVAPGPPKLPSFGDLFGGGGGGGAAKPPQTTVMNGKAMVMGPNGWVPQGSADGKSLLGGGGLLKQQGGPGSQVPKAGSYDPSGGPNLTNYAQKDPRIEQTNKMMDERYQQLGAREGQMDPYLMESIQNLRTQQGSDQTQRATNRALSSIRDQASGLQEAARERSAQMGQGGGMAGKIGEAAQRQGAKAASDIQLAQQQRMDALALGGAGILSAPSQLALQRAGQTNALLGQISGNAAQGGQLALGQQGLGLEQWKAGQDVGLRKQALDQQMALAPYDIAGKQLGLYSQYLNLLNGSGYGGY